jgi:hypothetical protein
VTSTLDLIQATVRLEQPIGNGVSTVGTGFVIRATHPDGSPQAVLVTANHVFARMPRDKAQVGFRAANAKGEWRFAPVSIRIRDADGKPMWTRHPTQDVAAIELPASVAVVGVPAKELPGERALATLRVSPGDEMMVLGYPRGFAANRAGFPILRAGRVASFPLSPAERYPTYMLDFSVFAGNSGGPVYIALKPRASRQESGNPIVITGLLTQQIKISGDRLAIGNVTQADFISETISLLGGEGPTEMETAKGELPRNDPQPAYSGPRPTSKDRLREAWRTTIDDFKILIRRAWIVTRDRVAGWLTPRAKRA